ncbi:TetR family transcriptional regulator [Micromonospora sp. LOL_024]|uniref:TetR family transcriptional regulator n=1 Tax=Micromonospora sp. LOL_024 TaxID=3345412 RepID=UPI003A868ED8
MPYRSTERVKVRLTASRERIVVAAIGILAEHGYAGCSVAAVAARAGVATGSVCRHFPAKSDLFAEVFRTASQREVDAVARAAAREGTAAALLAGYIADGVASGELPPQDPELTCTAVVGAMAEALVGPLAAGVAGPDTIGGLTTFLHRALGVSP